MTNKTFDDFRGLFNQQMAELNKKKTVEAEQIAQQAQRDFQNDLNAIFKIINEDIRDEDGDLYYHFKGNARKAHKMANYLTAIGYNICVVGSNDILIINLPDNWSEDAKQQTYFENYKL